jgi:hypothetical protein
LVVCWPALWLIASARHIPSCSLGRLVSLDRYGSLSNGQNFERS